jgi:hypothetical protein
MLRQSRSPMEMLIQPKYACAEPIKTIQSIRQWKLVVAMAVIMIS